MLLTELAVKNYKSFYEETRLKFGSGFNILLGANSSGKTTILEVIRFLEHEQVPHRSLANITEPDTPWTMPSVVNVRFSLPLTELKKLVHESGLIIMLSNEQGVLIKDIPTIDNFWRENPFAIEFQRNPLQGLEAVFFPAGFRSAARRSNYQTSHWRANLSANEIEYPSHAASVVGDNRGDIVSLATKIHDRIYRFSAERVVRATCGPSTHQLAPDASNLAYCINHLRSSDRYTFDLLTVYINRIFPNIHDISSVADSSATFQLSVHTVSPDKRRSDLAVRMDKVGTGISNALAMLYVVLTAQTPRIILLEEPNSYLHPRALRDLLSILAEAGAIHQFFITTHSSDVLRSVQASTVTLLENNGIKTTARQTHQHDLNSFKAGLLDLGIRLTDLHGCDRVLWVEGETEEAIFPKILSKFFPDIAQGIATLRLHATGDFEARKFKADKVASIYRRLSQSTFLAPPMVAITLDQEDRKLEQMEVLTRDTEGLVQFLPKAMIENYLVVPEAIAALLLSEYGKNIGVEDIKDAAAVAEQDVGNRIKPDSKGSSPIHYAKVLKAIFEKFGGEGATYNKAEHGPLLAEWILQNSPEKFDELREWFNGFINRLCD